METMESFGVQLLDEDHLLSFDIEKGYHHFRLHPSMRNWFLFVINGKCNNTKTTRVNDSIHWSTRLYSRRLTRSTVGSLYLRAKGTRAQSRVGRVGADRKLN
jgi:hypothetical protein